MKLFKSKTGRLGICENCKEVRLDHIGVILACNIPEHFIDVECRWLVPYLVIMSNETHFFAIRRAISLGKTGKLPYEDI